MARSFVLILLLAASCNLIRPPRHVELDGQSNFRDVGGYRTKDGGRVQWGQIYRSGALPDLSDRDVEFLERMGFRTAVDFRTKSEIEEQGRDRLSAGIRTIHLAIEGDARAEYAEFLRCAADPANRPLIFHGSMGVHRTGAATAILLSALGVPWKTVRKDYLLSNKYRKKDIDREVRRIRKERADELGVPVRKVNARKIKASLKLQGEDIDAFRDKILTDYESMEAYVTEGLGLTGRELDALRLSLLQ